MDAKQFLAEFGHIANAPGGVEQLRELVLHLAVTGDLISTDAPLDASPLLDVIEKQKREHPDRKKVIAKQAPISRAEIKAPPHWAVCRIGDLALTITGGGTPSKNHPAYWDGSIPWASVKDLKALKFIDDTEEHITEEGLKNSSSNLIPPGRIIVCTRMGLGKIAINRVDLAINQDLKALELPEEVNIDFFLILYKTREVKGSGTTVSGIKQNQLLALPAALPPLEEQSLIVAKVDELMALCDKLEAQQQDRRKLQNALRQSILQAVANATSPHELQTTWTRLANNFGQLFHVPEDAIDLDQCIKQLALKGLLSARAEGEMVNSKISELTQASTASVPDNEMDWSIPDHWVWAKCSWLGEARLGKMLDAAKNKGDLRPYLRNINVRWGMFNLSDVLQMRIEEHELPKVSVRKGDLVICEGGEPGRAAVWLGEEEFVIQKALHRFRCNAHVLPEYILFCLEHDYFSGRLSRYYTGATIKHLTGRALAEYPIPLPPLNEQKRILVATKELVHSVAILKEKLIAGNRCAAALAAASVASLTGLTGLTTEQEEEPMKAPQTELIAPLQLGTAPDIKAQAPLATILARHNSEMSAKDLWQRFGGEIDAFYAQLKTEVAHGWIKEPAPAEVREKPANTVSA
ncbi:restriction endonuclease subunit S [Dickeya fangzhongdai]|uniref:restriction endonuclease subunit S n=1 Tax=Dickeya fangzhongdai TaxID=1778540 RepID=UPI0023E3C3B1|nr:restriction endonuclease subunit S [Dickeya fangzhongdai]WES90647.1 restriction endonuclease subunit S [Dickeya fangzhongdai]